MGQLSNSIMSDQYEKPDVLEQIDAHAVEGVSHFRVVCSPASEHRAPEPASIPEKTCSKVKSKPGNGIGKRSSDVCVNRTRACASGPAKGARQHALPVKGSGKAETREDPSEGAKRKPRSVTVDTSKAKTSLEALKLSIRQLKWREVRSVTS